MMLLEPQTVTLNLNNYILDEVILVTVCWLMVVPWLALFMCRKLKDARISALFIGLGVPVTGALLYVLIGLGRLVMGAVFIW